MKTIVISAASAIFILGTASACEVNVSPIYPLHGAIVVERRVAQLNSADHSSGVPCGTRFIMTTSSDGNRITRKSVDCEE